MEEKVFFESRSNKVTNARFITNGQTYALANLTSVKMTETKPKWKFLLAIIGAFTIISGLSNFSESGGFMITVIGGLIFGLSSNMKPMYHIVTVSAGGESQALSSEDQTLITGIVNAINDAIVYRG